MYREVNLEDYLPQYLKEYRELKIIGNVVGDELEDLFDEIRITRQNQFIESCDEIGIAKFENLLGIVPRNSDNLESRINRVLLYWIEDIPYIYKTLKVQLDTYCGSNGYKMTLYNNVYQLDVMIKLGSKDMILEVEKLLKRVVPCNLGVKVYIDYNKHKDYRLFMEKELSVFTHRELREKVIIVDDYLHKNNRYLSKTLQDLSSISYRALRRKGEWYGK